jgi:hypothetical protein
LPLAPALSPPAIREILKKLGAVEAPFIVFLSFRKFTIRPNGLVVTILPVGPLFAIIVSLLCVCHAFLSRQTVEVEAGQCGVYGKCIHPNRLA